MRIWFNRMTGRTYLIMEDSETTELIAPKSRPLDSRDTPATLMPNENYNVNHRSSKSSAALNNFIEDLNCEILLLTFLSSIGGFLFGYDTGVISGAILMINEDPSISLDTFWTELIVSVTVSRKDNFKKGVFVRAIYIFLEMFSYESFSF